MYLSRLFDDQVISIARFVALVALCCMRKSTDRPVQNRLVDIRHTMCAGASSETSLEQLK